VSRLEGARRGIALGGGGGGAYNSSESKSDDGCECGCDVWYVMRVGEGGRKGAGV